MDPPARRSTFRIVIRRVEQPFEKSPDSELIWICQSLGLTSLTKDKITVEIFRLIVEASDQGKGISSTELAEKIHLSRGATIHHLNNLQQAGLVVKQGRLYFSRSRSMARTIQEIEGDISRIFQKMEETAREIDRAFGIPSERLLEE